MAINTNDINEIRVGVLGISVDASGTVTSGPAIDGQWMGAGPAGGRNTLNSHIDRVITRAINALDLSIGGMGTSIQLFDTRFNDVVGNEGGADQTAFDGLGKNLIQAVADLTAGGSGTGGLPIGGNTGEVLAKKSTTDFDVEWTPQTGGGGGANLSDAVPPMNGTGDSGVSVDASRADHVHPVDTSRASASDLTTHEGNAIIHITGIERTAWDGSVTNLASLTTVVNDLTFVKNVAYNSVNGDLTFTFRDNTTLTANVFVENLAEDIDYDSTSKELVITKKDGTEIRVDVSDLITVYHGSNGTHIQISIATGNVIEAVLKAGTIDETELTTALQGKINGKLDTTAASFLPLVGGTLTGVLTLAGAPIADLQAATKKYVDDEIADVWELV